MELTILLWSLNILPMYGETRDMNTALNKFLNIEILHPEPIIELNKSSINNWQHFEEKRPWMEIFFLEIFKKTLLPTYKMHVNHLIDANNHVGKNGIENYETHFHRMLTNMVINYPIKKEARESICKSIKDKMYELFLQYLILKQAWSMATPLRLEINICIKEINACLLVFKENYRNRNVEKFNKTYNELIKLTAKFEDKWKKYGEKIKVFDMAFEDEIAKKELAAKEVNRHFPDGEHLTK